MYQGFQDVPRDLWRDSGVFQGFQMHFRGVPGDLSSLPGASGFFFNGYQRRSRNVSRHCKGGTGSFESVSGGFKGFQGHSREFKRFSGAFRGSPVDFKSVTGAFKRFQGISRDIWGGSS